MPKTRRRNYAGPLVAQELVSDYLQRELDDFDWVKQVPRMTLNKLVGDFKFSTSYRSFLHQLQCFVIGIELPQFLFFQDMGAGKTALMLALFRWHREHSGVKRMLIIVPKEVHLQSWVDEIEIHAPDLTYTILLGHTAERRELVTEWNTDLYLINYPGLGMMMTELEEVKGKKGAKKKRKRQIDPKLAKKFASQFGMVVFDESHKIGNSESLTYRECRHFTKHCPFRYALTGTPFGRDPTMLWSQFHVVDNGETLGNTLGLFRAAFFNAKDRYWGGIEYTFDERMKEDLHRLLKHRSIYYQDTDFSDLPPIPPAQRLHVRFSTSAAEQYKNVLRRIKEARGSQEELKNAFVRMRMCTSGFMSVKSDIEGRLTMYFDENPKLDMLEEMLGDIPHDSKCIIYHEFVLTAKMICKMLDRNKIKYATLSGATKDPMQQMRLFLHDDKVRFMVANNESGSTGINPQSVANYMIFYESPVSPITRKQAVKRIHREGQKRHVHYYDLVVPKSIDERILDFLAEGEDFFQAIIQGKVSLEV